MLDDTSLAYVEAVRRGDTEEAHRLASVLDIATTLEQAQRDRTANLHTTALTYAEQSIAVFPIEPRGKRPLTRHGFKDATTNPDTITGWWNTTPAANIGIPTGTLFDVVDIDGIEGMASVYNGDDPVIASLNIIGIAITSRPGGRHIYVPPTELGNKTAILPGVDYRSTGGYVVAPPSVGANGSRYTWLFPLDIAQVTAA